MPCSEFNFKWLHNVPIFVLHVQMFICMLMWMSITVILFHVISSDGKCCFAPRESNFASVIKWQKIYFCLIFVITETNTVIQTLKVKHLKQLQLISTCVYLLRWVMQQVYITVKETMNISMTLVLFLNCKSVMNFLPIKVFTIIKKWKKSFLMSPDKPSSLFSHTLYCNYNK